MLKNVHEELKFGNHFVAHKTNWALKRIKGYNFGNKTTISKKCPCLKSKINLSQVKKNFIASLGFAS